MPDARRTRSLACKSKKHASKSPQVRRTIRHSLRDGVTAYTWSPRCTGLFSHRRPEIITPGLDPSVGRSGPHDFAVRCQVARQSTWLNVHRLPRSTFVTTRTPLFMSTGYVHNSRILIFVNKNIFVPRTGQAKSAWKSFAKIVFRRARIRGTGAETDEIGVTNRAR
jgi:hypothetical protein